MELLFTWIKDYRNIQNQGINFSAEFNISFNPHTKVLSIEKAQNYIPLFFGKMISNISVIVGENGTGKTSILNLKGATLYLVRKEDKYSLFCSEEMPIEEILFSSIVEIEKIEHLKLDKTLVVFYSNYVDSDIGESDVHPFFSQITSTLNISTNSLVKQIVNFKDDDLDGSFVYSDSKPIIREIQMHIAEIWKQMNFILKSENSEKLTFKTPDTLFLTFNLDAELLYIDTKSKTLNRWLDPLDLNNPNRKKYRKIIEGFLKNQLDKVIHETVGIEENDFFKERKPKIFDKHYIMFLLRWSMFFNFINSFSSPNIEDIEIEEWLSFNSKWESEPIERWFNTFFEEYIINSQANIGRKQTPQVKAWTDNAVNFVNKFEKFIQNSFVSFHTKNMVFDETISSHRKNIEISINIQNDFNRALTFDLLVSEYQKIINPNYWLNNNRHFLSFSWRGVSSGELAMLRVFTRFNSIREIIKRKREIPNPNYNQTQITHLLFLIDEGEIGLHPTWQQQFLNTLIENLPRMFKDDGVKSIQLVLATHSPFILSDVPNNHVIFLEKDEEGKCKVIKNPLHDKKMTFGANIHSLLSDGFFMKEGLMGDFAKKKINQLIDDLLEKGNQLSPERKVEIQKMIPLIGEPIIRKKVMDLYNEQINLNIDDRIRLLEESRKQLEKDIQMLKEAKRDDSNKKK